MADVSAVTASTSTAPAPAPSPAPEAGGHGSASAPPPPRPPSATRRWLRTAPGRAATSALIVVVVGSIAAFSGDLWGLRERLQPLPRAAAPLAHGAPAAGGRPVLASTPYWQTVASLQGDSSGAARTVDITPGALQWRVSWSCSSGGRISVQTAGQATILDGACPGKGSVYPTQTGSVPLSVHAGGAWSLEVEQQVDVPVSDPPLAAMSAPGASAVFSGSFYGIDFDGRGTVTVYRLADGQYALRLDGFYVTPNSSLDIRFSTASAPHSDDDVASSNVAPVAGLDATAGSLNLSVPAGVDPTRFRSLVVWCISLRTAYAAATLQAAAR
ncbi:MAG TPA: DM13 domain-containing protein [Candidatus Dormibacteraeota bacterium]|nr:DM13 domain-containing protein [Candidatus Dormibacteraeota bacterium]